MALQNYLLTPEHEKAAEALRYANSFNRMSAVLKLRRHMEKADWLRLLGDKWDICDGLYRHEGELRQLLGEQGPIREMMTVEESMRWDALPSQLIVYRGASRRYPPGMSWSLDKAVAARFPFLNRYHVDDPALFTAEVSKQDILALKGEREEEELIILKVKIVEVVPLARQGTS